MNPITVATATRKRTSASGRCPIRVILLVVPILLCAVLLPSCNLIGTALGLGLAKLQFGCLPEGTRIDTAHGTVKIEDLKSGDTITGFNGSEVRISQIHQYQVDPASSQYLTIHFSNGSTVSASPRHRIDGTPAGTLKIGDSCGSQVVTRIEALHGVSRSFDLLTGDPGYRIGGIPVNSMIEEMLGQAARPRVTSSSASNRAAP
ncbi:MAG: Hint domain-containing protein [Verrucomicrobiota bacterium]